MDAVYCQKHRGSIGVATCKLCVIEELKQQRDHLESENAKQAEMLNKVIEQRDELLAALESLEKDNHTYQTRPCPTCRKITSTLGRPFGCNAKERNAAIAKVKGE